MTDATRQVIRRIITEKFSNEIAYFVSYMRNGMDPYDFGHMLLDYFDDLGETPKDFDPDEALDYLEEMTEEERKVFKAWLEKNMDKMDYDDPTLPTYLYMSFEGIVPPSTWLVHFSDDAYNIAWKGFIYGQPGFTELGLTVYLSDRWRKDLPGWNFGFEALDTHSMHNAVTDKKYGNGAVLFQSAGVRTYHFGDEEHQVIFQGESVERVILIQEDDIGWYIADVRSGRPLVRDEDFHKVVNWAIANEQQYRRVIYSQPAKVTV
jgi:hypothetical protein